MYTPSDSLQDDFERFIEFGTLLDRQTRRYLVRYLQSKLNPSLREQLDLPELDKIKDTYYRYFCDTLDQLFDGNQLVEMCLQHPALSEEVTRQSLQWLRRTYRRMREKNPYAHESQRLEAATVVPLRQFVEKWRLTTRFLQETYHEQEFPTGFYVNKFETLIADRPIEAFREAEKTELERILHDLLAQWDARLSGKILAFQLKRLAEEAQDFADELGNKSTNFSRLYKLLSPFGEYVGKYWNMSQELWEESNFDLLERYDALLANEKSVQELADLLGRLKEAELETEEEIYEDVVVQQRFTIKTDERAEIVGVHASDDLNNLLSTETSLLGDPDTETIFLKRFADKQLQTFRYEHERSVPSPKHFTNSRQLVKRKERGPFIVCVDTSDSMSGHAEQIAKVLCFAILKLAARDNRKAYLINFSVGIKVIDLYDIGRSLDQIVAFLQMSFYGGTDITLALHEVLRQLRTESYKDADVLMISDFIMYKVEDEVLEQISHHQQRNDTRFHCLTLADDPNAEVIEKFDTNWIYDPKSKGVIRELAGELRKLGQL
ncbi:MAG: VWA domain-containing protein [Bacteroidota bacterium]